jgi:cobalamin biosynthesis Mg chelatase CobN
MVNEKDIGKTETTQDSNAGLQPERLGKIERAELAVKRMEDAEKRLDDKISRLTELEANRLLGGTAGGHVEPVPAKVETAKEYADRVMNNKPIIKNE